MDEGDGWEIDESDTINITEENEQLLGSSASVSDIKTPNDVKDNVTLGANSIEVNNFGTKELPNPVEVVVSDEPNFENDRIFKKQLSFNDFQVAPAPEILIEPCTILTGEPSEFLPERQSVEGRQHIKQLDEDDSKLGRVPANRCIDSERKDHLTQDMMDESLGIQNVRETVSTEQISTDNDEESNLKLAVMIEQDPVVQPLDEIEVIRQKAKALALMFAKSVQNSNVKSEDSRSLKPPKGYEDLHKLSAKVREKLEADKIVCKKQKQQMLDELRSLELQKQQEIEQEKKEEAEFSKLQEYEEMLENYKEIAEEKEVIVQKLKEVVRKLEGDNSRFFHENESFRDQIKEHEEQYAHVQNRLVLFKQRLMETTLKQGWSENARKCLMEANCKLERDLKILKKQHSRLEIRFKEMRRDYSRYREDHKMGEEYYIFETLFPKIDRMLHSLNELCFNLENGNENRLGFEYADMNEMMDYVNDVIEDLVRTTVSMNNHKCIDAPADDELTSIVNRMNDTANTILMDIEKINFKDVLQRFVGLKTAYDEAMNQLADIKSCNKNLVIELHKLTKISITVISKVEKLGEFIPYLDDYINNLERDKNEFKEMKETYEIDNESLRNSIDCLTERIKVYMEQLTDREQQVIELTSRLNDSVSEYNAHRGECERNTEEIEYEMKHLAHERFSLMEDSIAMDRSYDSLKEEYNRCMINACQMQENIVRLQAEITAAHGFISKLNDDVTLLQNEKSNLQVKCDLNKRLFDNLNVDFIRLEEQNKSLQHELETRIVQGKIDGEENKKMSDKCKAMEKELSELRRSLEDKDTVINELKNKNKVLEDSQESKDSVEVDITKNFTDSYIRKKVARISEYAMQSCLYSVDITSIQDLREKVESNLTTNFDELLHLTTTTRKKYMKCQSYNKDTDIAQKLDNLHKELRCLEFVMSSRKLNDLLSNLNENSDVVTELDTVSSVYMADYDYASEKEDEIQNLKSKIENLQKVNMSQEKKLKRILILYKSRKGDVDDSGDCKPLCVDDCDDGKTWKRKCEELGRKIKELEATRKTADSRIGYVNLADSHAIDVVKTVNVAEAAVQCNIRDTEIEKSGANVVEAAVQCGETTDIKKCTLDDTKGMGKYTAENTESFRKSTVNRTTGIGQSTVDVDEVKRIGTHTTCIEVQPSFDGNEAAIPGNINHGDADDYGSISDVGEAKVNLDKHPVSLSMDLFQSKTRNLSDYLNRDVEGLEKNNESEEQMDNTLMQQMSSFRDSMSDEMINMQCAIAKFTQRFYSARNTERTQTHLDFVFHGLMLNLLQMLDSFLKEFNKHYTNRTGFTQVRRLMWLVTKRYSSRLSADAELTYPKNITFDEIQLLVIRSMHLERENACLMNMLKSIEQNQPLNASSLGIFHIINEWRNSVKVALGLQFDLPSRTSEIVDPHHFIPSVENLDMPIDCNIEIGDQLPALMNKWKLQFCRIRPSLTPADEVSNLVYRLFDILVSAKNLSHDCIQNYGHLNNLSIANNMIHVNEFLRAMIILVSDCQEVRSEVIRISNNAITTRKLTHFVSSVNLAEYNDIDDPSLQDSVKWTLVQHQRKVLDLEAEIASLKRTVSNLPFNKEKYLAIEGRYHEALCELEKRNTDYFDVCRELAMLVEERDQLQLKLSSALRKLADLPKIETVLTAENKSNETNESSVLELKLEELQEVNYMKDPNISEPSKQHLATQMHLCTDGAQKISAPEEVVESSTNMETTGFSVPSFLKWFSDTETKQNDIPQPEK